MTTKTNNRFSMTAAITFAASSIVAFIAVPAKTEIFWISYISLLSVFAMAFFFQKLASKDTDKSSSFVLTTISGIHAATVVMAILIFAVGLNVAPQFYAAIHFLILGGFASLLLLGDANQKYIQVQEAALNYHTSFNKNSTYVQILMNNTQA